MSPSTAPPPLGSLFDLSGRVAIVTGAGAGIGAGIARRFAAAGAAVVVHYDRNLAGATSVVREIDADGGRAAAVAADLTNAAAAAHVVDFSSRTLGVATIVVNNAGTYPLATIRDMTEAQWRSVIDANLTTTHLMTQAATRGMLAGGLPGAIVNIASIEAANVAPAHAHYGAAKAALLMYTRAAAREFGPAGIRVNAVSPGLIWRDGLDEAWPDGAARYLRAAPLGRLGQPADVADACLFLVSDAARWITGVELTVDGGVLTSSAY